MIPDQSAWQHIEFTLSQSNPIDVLEFLKQQQVKIYIPNEAKHELGYQVYKPNLFSGVYNYKHNSITAKNDFSDTAYTFSKTNGSLTPTNLQQPYGPDVNIVESNAFSSITLGNQLSLWDMTATMKKLARNKRSLAGVKSKLQTPMW